jgi:Fe-S oxidoreductase
VAYIENDSNVKKSVFDAVNAIKNGPLPLRLYMEICAKCGTCSTVCPIHYGSQERSRNPVERSNLVRKLYKRHNSLSGKLFGDFSGNKDFDPKEI